MGLKKHNEDLAKALRCALTQRINELGVNGKRRGTAQYRHALGKILGKGGVVRRFLDEPVQLRWDLCQCATISRRKSSQ